MHSPIALLLLPLGTTLQQSALQRGFGVSFGVDAKPGNFARNRFLNSACNVVDAIGPA